jgi:hypothetical protein
LVTYLAVYGSDGTSPPDHFWTGDVGLSDGGVVVTACGCAKQCDAGQVEAAAEPGRFLLGGVVEDAQSELTDRFEFGWLVAADKVGCFMMEV